MLLVVTYAAEARTSLRNVCRTHEETVVRQFGRAALLKATEHGAFLGLWLREKHPDDVQLERTAAFNEFRDVREPVRVAAEAYANRSETHTPYAKFAVDSPHPEPSTLREQEL